jgi:hypothetical protein
MSNRTPAAGRAIAPRPVDNADFAPVPRKTLSGWTPDRQRRFIAALAATGSVAASAASVGMTREGAYLLRAAPGSADFVLAWDTAVRRGIGALRAVAFDRAINGEAEPVFYQGEQVGERRLYNNQLLMRLLTHYDRQASVEAAAKAPSIDDPRPSSPAVAARLASKAKPIRSMDADDHRRNQQWIDYHRLNQAIGEAVFVNRLRGWIAEGGLATIIAQLDYLDRRHAADGLLTAAMRAEIAATDTLAQPWHDRCAGLATLLTAERVEAAANAGVLPVH